MRFMILVKSGRGGEIAPAIGKYEAELAKAGALLAAEGCDGRLVDGPFAETEDLVAGFWRSEEAAIEWGKRRRADVRQVFDAGDLEETLAGTASR